MKDEEARTLITSAMYRCYCGVTANRLIEVINRVFEAKAVKTNGDRIRSMTDEELAKVVYRGCPPPKDKIENCLYAGEDLFPEDCQDCWLDWLGSSCNVANAHQYHVLSCQCYESGPEQCRCGGPLSEIRYHDGKPYRHCFACHFEFYEEGDNS